MLNLQQRRDLADRLLIWLKAKKLKRWGVNHTLFFEFSEEVNEPLYDVWKAYDLLRYTGRLGLNNPNGRKGGYVISFTPLSKPAGREKEIDVNKFKAKLLKRILKDLKSQFANEWDSTLGEMRGTNENKRKETNGHKGNL